MRKVNKYHYIIIAFLLGIIAVMFGGGGIASADNNSGYSNVADDLQKDENFNVWDYPAVPTDYSLQVIQIAESTAGELFIYVYQPSGQVADLRATCVNMSLLENFESSDYDDNFDSDNNSLTENVPSTYLYDLTFLNSTGVFYKYKITDFKVSSDPVRYYNITSIYRAWLDGIDEPLENDNDTVGVSFKVGKCFKAETNNSEINYSYSIRNTVLIKNPYVDFLRYFDGLENFWGVGGNLGFTDMHYIAFDTDWKIDELYEAEVSFYTQTYSVRVGFNNYEYGERVKHPPVTLTGKKIGNSGNGLFGEKYEWNEIQPVEEFIKIDGLQPETITEVSKCKWVLLFYTTNVDRQIKSGGVVMDNGTKVSAVTVLRLKFISGGQCYNLGVVSNQQTGDNNPGNLSGDIGFWKYIWRCIVRLFNGTATLTEQIIAIVSIFICVLALPVLLIILSLCIPSFGAFMKVILKGIWTGIKYLFIGLWWVIKSPYLFIRWLIDKKNGG